MKKLDTLFMILLIVGGINWGLVGLFNIDLVATLFGSMPVVAKVVYGLVGVAGVMKLMCLFKGKCCDSSCEK